MSIKATYTLTCDGGCGKAVTSHEPITNCDAIREYVITVKSLRAGVFPVNEHRHYCEACFERVFNTVKETVA